MSTFENQFEQEPAVLITGYLDGELTQQEAQKVAQLLETRPDYQQLYLELSQMRHQVQSLSLQQQELEHLDKLLNEPVAKLWQVLGMIMLVMGALTLTGFTLFKIFSHPELGLVEKFLVGSIGCGGLLLLASVLRQRLLNLKNDKYKRVKL